MTLDEIRTLVAAMGESAGCFKELRDALAKEERIHAGRGRAVVHDLVGILRVRSETSEAAGIEPCGFDETLIALAALPADERVETFHFKSQRRYFSLLVSESTRTIIGCICVNGRDARRSPVVRRR